ncbi:FAD-binding domain-containing protein [Daldinia loculata]|uniref:FAD-binding domain-containing protein n=1 Tax=Daldinia loculata TaxID=103429 RepID=UPI0020C23C3A|nr:FAD-binding domain-containing protein [Daldinia loculata]KAI1652078.1 FAD-binding domain-containing protein [Daldinia loculata]
MSTAPIIEALKQVLPADQLHFRGTDEFDKINGSYLSALENDITPVAIILPKTPKDISTFLLTINPFVARGEMAFAIRGAGQQPLPGCANIQGGITLDLRLLTGIDLDLDTGIVSIAAGERWGTVYEKLHEHGLGVTGSRSAKGGIGGLALSGGLSFFSSREGLICDNVINYEVVLASGEVVSCNANDHQDLWKALRGGGNSFGIVTRYDMRTFKQGPFWGGSVFYYPASFPSQIDALVQQLQNPEAETHIMISLFFAAQFGQPMGLNQLYYTREVESPPVLDPFVKVQPQLDQLNSMRMVNLKDAAAEQAAMAMEGIRCAYMNTTVKADAETLKAAAEAFSASLDHVEGFEDVVFSLTLQPYPVSLLEQCISAGGNATGLTPTTGPLVSILVLINWKNKSDDTQILAVGKDLLDTIERDSVARGQAVPYKYLNYSFNFQDPISSYGPENKSFLQQVSKIYDPDGIFQKGFPGGFKLFV